jgi:methylated-DNA-[protein]-cysteine S-methyltransferase
MTNKTMRNISFYRTDIGKIGIVDSNNSITNVYFHGESFSEDAILHETGPLKEANRQLQSYLTGKQKVFKLRLAPVGTGFMLRVWEALSSIPYGENRSYEEIAQKVGNKKASRAVGLAASRNPIPIFIPCHRVIGKNGKLTGYRSGLHIKEHLLKLEKQNARH